MEFDPSSSSPAAFPSVCAYPALPPPVDVPLTILSEHPCPYLPGRVAQSRALWAERMAGEVYRDFMDAGFRRSGKLLYQPVCRGCRECVPLRVPVATFAPSKSQRRCQRHNDDLSVAVGLPEATDEKYALYGRYIAQWHRKADEGSRDEFEAFLYDSPVDSIEFSYRDPSGALLAVGICDVCPQSLSSVYFYFDPAFSGRGLGTFGALYELEWAKDAGIPHYYLGYWIDQCQSMRYKATYRPNEVLHPDGVWRPAGTREGGMREP